MTKTVRSLLFVFVVASLVLAACGSPAATEAPAEPTAAPVEDPMAMYAPDAVSGDIVTAGSSTVCPIAERMKQRFEEEGFSGEITVDSIGSGAGLERFCVAGETDIANSSRKIKDGEVESCRGIGREPIEFQVGIDALAVVVSADNDFAADVTLD